MECLPPRRQRAGEYLESDDRLDKKAAIGLSGGKPTIKLNKWKRRAASSKLARVCICEDYALEELGIRVSLLLRPACQSWPAVS